MDILIRILDVASAVLIVTSLALVTRWHKVWLLYVFSTFLFVIVQVYNQIPGSSMMGIVLLAVGLKNYWVEKRKKDE